MPIYEYKCDHCGHSLEAIQKISEPRLVTCPQCGQDTLRKKVSAAGFRLKGGGWYETDFKAGKKKNVSGAESSGDGASSGSDGGGGSGGESAGGATTSGDGAAAKKPESSSAKPAD